MSGVSAGLCTSIFWAASMSAHSRYLLPLLTFADIALAFPLVIADCDTLYTVAIRGVVSLRV
jgi:hypothetical protein